MDRITLTRIVACGRHGADPGERDETQPFHIDVAFDLDLSRAAASDRLNDTLNYAELYRTIVKIVETRSYELLERLAAEISAEIMSDERVQRATVTIAKPQLLDGATPAVTLVREREKK
jgi:7,8-dihydroneopterin aldolase/epimerase/oxygenase